MSAITEILVYLIQTVAVLYTLLVILRFFLQLAKANFYNPVCQFVATATSPPLLVLRRFMPGYFGLDMAAIALAIIVQTIAILVLLILLSGPLLPAKILTWSLINVIGLTTKIFFFSVLAGIILSWIAPQTNHPLAELIFQINEPVMAPFRRLLPAMGGMDFSPILVFVSINIIDILLARASAASGMYSIIAFGL